LDDKKMLLRNHEMHQTNFSGKDLLLQLDPNDPLLKLSTVIPWRDFDEAFSKITLISYAK